MCKRIARIPPGSLVLVLLALVCLVSCQKSHTTGSVSNAVEWTAINVNSAELQSDANLVLFANGQNYLIDAGDANGKLVSELKDKHVQTIEAVIISHAHQDHYSGLVALLNSSIRVKRVLFQHSCSQCL